MKPLVKTITHMKFKAFLIPILFDLKNEKAPLNDSLECFLILVFKLHFSPVIYTIILPPKAGVCQAVNFLKLLERKNAGFCFLFFC